MVHVVRREYIRPFSGLSINGPETGEGEKRPSRRMSSAAEPDRVAAGRGDQEQDRECGYDGSGEQRRV